MNNRSLTSIKRVEFGILFLVCFLPYYSLLRGLSLIYLPEVLNSVLNYIRDIVIILLFLISFTRLSKKNIFLGKQFFFVSLFLFFLFFFFMVTFTKGYPGVAIKSAHLTIVPILLFYSSKVVQKYLPDFFLKLIKILFVVGITVICLSIYFFFNRSNLYVELFSILYSSKDNLALSYVRMMGPFFSPNVFGNFMGVISLISFIRVLDKDKRIVINWGVFFLATFCVILSFSRGSWLFEFIGVFTIMVFKKKIFKFIKVAIIGILISFLGVTSLSNSSGIDLENVTNNRFQSLLGSTDGNVYNRFDNLNEITKSLNKSPLGKGLGAGSQASYGNQKYLNEIELGVIDSFYLKTLVEGGMFFLLIFLIVMFSLLQGLKKKINNYKSVNRNNFILLTFAVLIGTMMQSIGSNPLDYVSTAPFVWILLGVSSELKNI